ncbi:MAG: hypothetical protein CUN54_00385 [Phototrophicales bacterium]|nr:MAG: hypothetical protein CUN54_00385 [Phototrophicales bacterium]
MIYRLSSKHVVMCACLAFLLAACNFTRQRPVTPSPSPLPASPTPLVMSPTATMNSAAEVSSTATPVDVAAAQLVVASPTAPPPPTMTFTPSPTPGPYEHTLQEGQTLIAIVQLYGYRDFTSILDEVVRLNPEIPNADSLPGPGTVILIPRQTSTPTSEAVAQSDGASAPPTQRVAAAEGNVLTHVVEEGQTMVDIAVIYDTPLDVLAQMNPDIGFFGCDFDIPGGGPNCIINLQIGQEVRVPAPTPTPTLSPTPSGNETATFTPTFAAPVITSPPENAIMPAGIFNLQWVSVGILAPDEVYLIQITDTVTGQTFRDITRNTSYMIPASLIPADGQSHRIEWTVAVAKPNADGVYALVSGISPAHVFEWQSR